MVRETRQFNIRSRTICPAGKHYAQNTRSFNGIFAKGFVKITHAEQQQCTRVFYLDGIVLLH